MFKQIPGSTQTVADLATAAPVGTVGIDLTTYNDTARPSAWLVTATVTTAPSDLTMWGCLAQAVANDESDDKWGVATDRYGRAPLGKLGTALPVGVYHFVVHDVGIYQRLYFQKSAGNVELRLTPVYFAGRSS